MTTFVAGHCAISYPADTCGGCEDTEIRGLRLRARARRHETRSTRTQQPQAASRSTYSSTSLVNAVSRPAFL
jgi:hypothetical protein